MVPLIGVVCSFRLHRKYVLLNFMGRFAAPSDVEAWAIARYGRDAVSRFKVLSFD